MIHRVGTAVLLLALCSGTLRADDVYLKNGRKLSGEVTDLGDKIKLKLAGGITVTLSKDEIVRIIKKATPAPSKKSPAGKKPAPAGKPKPKKDPAKPERLEASAATSFPTDIPQIEKIEYREDQKYVALHSAGNVTAQIWETRGWNMVHSDGLKVLYPKGSQDILCLKQTRGEFGNPVLHRLRDVDVKKEIRFGGAIVQGLTSGESVTWVAGWRGTFIIAWNRDQPEEPAYQKQAFRSRIYDMRAHPKKDVLIAHGDRSWILWDLKEGRKLQELDYSKLADFSYLGSAMSDDRRVIVLWAQDRIAVVDPETLDIRIGEELDVKLTKRAWLSPGGNWLAVAAQGPKSPREYPIAVISAKSMKSVKLKADLSPITFPLPNSLFFSPDDRFFGANPNRGPVSVFSTETWEQVVRHEVEGKHIVAGAISPRGRQLILADGESHVYVLSLEKDKK